MVSSESDGPRHPPAPSVAQIPAVPESTAVDAHSRADPAPPSPPTPPSSTGVTGIDPEGLHANARGPHANHAAPYCEAGEGGEGGGSDESDAQPRVTNDEFVRGIFGDVAAGQTPAVCSKVGDPTKRGWPALPAGDVNQQCKDERNNFASTSVYSLQADGRLLARKGHAAATYCLMLDDVGTKVPRDGLHGVVPSWIVETSPGNYQYGFIFTEPVRDAAVVDRLFERIVDAGLCDRGASGPVTRWFRLPNGVNGKPKHIAGDGRPFRCRLEFWDPTKRYSPTELADALGLPPALVRFAPEPAEQRAAREDCDAVFKRRALENPVVVALKEAALYKTELAPGKHDITCPWVEDHTDAIDNGAAYFEPNIDHPVGGFRCHHSHGDDVTIRDLLAYLKVTELDARWVPVITVRRGELERLVRAAECVLADSGHYFVWGGLIACVRIDSGTGFASIAPTNVHGLTRTLSALAFWQHYDGRKRELAACDPPIRIVVVLHGSESFTFLPPLLGIARQPYLDENGELVAKAGYNMQTKMFGAFKEDEYEFVEPTHDAAKEALRLLRSLLSEFKFATPADESAALAAILTAVVRSLLPYAPAFHVTAPVSGSGKTYLCLVISRFAGPEPSAKISFPVRAEEASKVILAALLSGPTVLEFDDMAADWTPHGVVNRMITSATIDERVLGVSKVAKVSTRVLVLASGNNVGPTGDLLRRVVTIRLDRRTETPATAEYRGDPAEDVRRNRAKYVSAALTIIRAWRRAGSLRAGVSPVVSFADWADSCRHPLLWLGLPDPATSILEQLRSDPDRDALREFLRAWFHVFGSTPTTARKALKDAEYSDVLEPAMEDLPIRNTDGSINRSKFGKYLGRNANRIVDGMELQKCRADGRTAWRVVLVDSATEPEQPADMAPAPQPLGPRAPDFDV